MKLSSLNPVGTGFSRFEMRDIIVAQQLSAAEKASQREWETKLSQARYEHDLMQTRAARRRAAVTLRIREMAIASRWDEVV